MLGDKETVECVVSEYNLPDGTGLAVFESVRELAPDTACVLFTETRMDDIDTATFGDVVAEYIHKSDGARTELLDVVQQTLALHSQTAYPLPANEDARVATLRKYTSETEALGDSLDRLTEIATELLGVHSAAIGIIDTHTEEFLSCYGADFEAMDREDSLCTYAILDDDITVVEDVQADPRFADNDALQAANIRFYASSPLVTPSGEAIGTFCIQHDEPGELADRDHELLTMLADEAMDQFVLRRRLRDAREGRQDG